MQSSSQVNEFRFSISKKIMHAPYEKQENEMVEVGVILK